MIVFEFKAKGTKQQYQKIDLVMLDGHCLLNG
jgi:hypothetical protein